MIGDAYWDGIAPREKLLDLIARNDAKINESAGYTSLPSIGVSQGVHFYQARHQKIAKLLNSPQ
ncbi:hypothetical protein IM774_05465 [Erysipelotrichaceae bacterium RD49]|nr:hypothetical protein [Erysipelotrichaceae bacterium RD49]